MDILSFVDLKSIGLASRIFQHYYDSHPLWSALQARYGLSYHPCLILSHFCDTCRIGKLNRCICSVTLDQDTYSTSDLNDLFETPLWSLTDDENVIQTSSIRSMCDTKVKDFLCCMEIQKVTNLLLKQVPIMIRFSRMKLPQPTLDLGKFSFNHLPLSFREQWTNLWNGYAIEWMKRESQRHCVLPQHLSLPWNTKYCTPLFVCAEKKIYEEAASSMDPYLLVEEDMDIPSYFNRAFFYNVYYDYFKAEIRDQIEEQLDQLYRTDTSDCTIVDLVVKQFTGIQRQFVKRIMLDYVEKIYADMSAKIEGTDDEIFIPYKNKNIRTNLKKLVRFHQRQHLQLKFQKIVNEEYPMKSLDTLSSMYGSAIRTHVFRLEIKTLRKIQDMPSGLHRSQLLRELGLSLACSEYKHKFCDAYADRWYHASNRCEECFENSAPNHLSLCTLCSDKM